MNLWNYYNNKSNQLKYPNVLNHTHEKEIAKTNPKWTYEYVSKHGKDEDLEPIITIKGGKPTPLGVGWIA